MKVRLPAIPIFLAITALLSLPLSHSSVFGAQADQASTVFSLTSNIAPVVNNAIIWGTPTLVESSADYPQISIDEHDRVFVSYRKNYETYIRRSDNSGLSFGTSVLAASPTFWPHALWAGASGNIYITWAQGPISMTHSIDLGTTFGSQVRIDDGSGSSGNFQMRPDLVQDSSGTLYAVWPYMKTTCCPISYENIYFAKSNNNGASFSPMVRVEDFPHTGNVTNAWLPSVAVAPNGYIYVVWEDYRVSGESIDIYFTRSTNGGATFEPSRRVNDVAAYGPNAESPNLAIYGNDRVYVVWSDPRNGNQDIYFARSIDSGISFQPNQRLNDDTGTMPQGAPAIAVSATGQILVSWFDRRNSTQSGNGDVYTTLSTDGGITFGPNTRVNSQANTVTWAVDSYPAFDSSGTPHIVWQSSDIINHSAGTGSSYSISGQVTGSGSCISGVTISDGAGHATTTDSNGTYALTNLPAGTYTLSASKSGCKFWPPSSTISLSVNTTINFSEWTCSTNVPLYLQAATAWNQPGQTYAGSPYTIAQKGCALTSDAMVLSYFGQFYSPPFQTDPGALNTALMNFPNGFSNLNVNPVAFQSYARSKGVWLFQAGTGQDNSNDRQNLEQVYLCAGNPVILQVPSPWSSTGSHFVVATGKATINGQGTYTLNDPAFGHVTLLEKYNNHFASAFYYVNELTGSTYHRSLGISAHSPVQLLVTDALGHQVGYDPRIGMSYNEIPNAGYVTGAIVGPDGSSLPDFKYVLIPESTNSPYNVQVIGTGSGPFTIDALQADSSGNMSVTSQSGTAQPNSVNSYIVNTSSFLFLPLIRR